MDQLLTDTPFDSLPIPEPVLRGIHEAGYTRCTPIQGKVLPIALAGKDVAGQAQTGTGKTAAFLISMFSRLLLAPPPQPAGKRSGWVAPRGLVVAPTRELARQIEKDALLLGQHCGFKIVCIHGGIDYEKQKNQIKEGADILIVTPGRLIDYYKQRFFSLKSVEVLVIDEADRLFDMGFIADARFILRNLSPYHKRLSMLFSATLSHQVMELAYEHMNNAEKVAVSPEKIVVDQVEQSLYHVGAAEKVSLLLGLLHEEKMERAIIFCNMKRTAEELAARLQHSGFKADQISGDVRQRTRIRVLEQFTNGEINILIATDVASRGLHVDNVTHVVNYDLPFDPEDYIHRIGRTARAGAKGKAISLCCEDYVDSLEKIEETLKRQLPMKWAEDHMYVDTPPLPSDVGERLARGRPPARRGGGKRRGPPPRGRSGGSRPPHRQGGSSRRTGSRPRH